MNVSSRRARSLTDAIDHFQLDMKRLEIENNELRMTLDHVKRQHELERVMLEDGHKHRLEYIEKTSERKESRYRSGDEHRSTPMRLIPG